MPKVRRLREKLTYSNVMSTLCLFLLLGGGAYAAVKLPKNSVGTKQLKNHAVTGQKVAANTLTGANINASTLGTVPNAAHAASADTATNAANTTHATTADNADKLGGLLPSAFQARVSGACEPGESVASVTQEGGVNCTVNGGPPSGPAGGSLAGTYPNPSLASNSVDTANFKATATAPNATKLNGIESSGFLQNGQAAGGTLAGTYPNPSLASNSVDTANFKATATAPNATKLNGIESSGFLQNGQAAGGALSGTYPNPTLASKPVVASGGSGATTAIGTSCTHYAGGEVTINAPSAGTVVISANAWLFTSHTSGISDLVVVSIGTTASDCSSDFGFATAYGIPAAMPTYTSVQTTIPVSRVVSVSAGPHTFNLNGIQYGGTDTEDFYYTGMTAIFIPA